MSSLHPAGVFLVLLKTENLCEDNDKILKTLIYGDDEVEIGN